MEKERKIYMVCPCCNKRHAFLPREKTIYVKINDVEHKTTEKYFCCLYSSGENTFTTPALDRENKARLERLKNGNKKPKGVRFALARVPKYTKISDNKWEYNGVTEELGLIIDERFYLSKGGYKPMSKIEIIKKFNNIPE